MKRTVLHNIIFTIIFLSVLFSFLEIIQRYKHPHVGFRGMYNSLGFRGNELNPNKESQTIRILFVGSSTIFGVGNNLENTIPFLTEQILNKELNPQRVEVINGAMPAKNSFWIVERINDSLFLRPDIIIVMSGYNDSAGIYNEYVKFDKGGNMIVREPWHLKLNTFLARHSVFYVTLKEKIAIILYGNPRFAFLEPMGKHNEDESARHNWLNYYPRLYKQNLEKMVDICYRYSIKLIFLDAPLSMRRKIERPLYAKAFFRLKEELFKVSRDHHIPIIDLQNPLSERRLGEYILPDGIHFTDRGNLKIAQTISDSLIRDKKEYFLH